MLALLETPQRRRELLGVEEERVHAVVARADVARQLADSSPAHRSRRPH